MVICFESSVVPGCFTACVMRRSLSSPVLLICEMRFLSCAN